MNRRIEVSPLLRHVPKVRYNWSYMHGQVPPKDSIELTHGFIHKIRPISLRTVVRGNLTFYPVHHFGIIIGPLIEEAEILVSFMEDMREFHLTHGALRYYKID